MAEVAIRVSIPLMDERLLKKTELAEYWNVSYATIDKWVAAGKLKPIRTPGGSPRFIHPEDERNAPRVGQSRKVTNDA